MPPKFGSDRGKRGYDSTANKWANGRVAYMIDRNAGYKAYEYVLSIVSIRKNSKRLETISRALVDIEARTCIRFVELSSNSEHHILVTKTGEGCHSQIGDTR